MGDGHPFFAGSLELPTPPECYCKAMLGGCIMLMMCSGILRKRMPGCLFSSDNADSRFVQLTLALVWEC